MQSWRLIAMLTFGLLTAPVGAAEWQVSERTLDNGLHVLVREDHRAPVVVSQLWYRVGSSYEHRGITGISHLLEHMMFKGTEKHPAGEFSEIIARNGGRQNAFTGHDYTTYFEQLAADRLEIAFRLEADRMHNLLLPPEEFEKENQVVIEERRLRVEDSPLGVLAERFATVAYPASGYGQPVIGWPNDLRRMTVDDLERWYRRWYVPRNATLVVAGDVEPEAVFELAEKYFGDIPSGAPPPEPPDVDLDAVGERRLVMHDPRAKVPHLAMAYGVPSLNTVEDPDTAYALMVLAAVLDGGDAARLPSSLVREQGVAAGVSAGYSGVARLDTLFRLDATPARDHTVAELEAALREEIARLRSEPVSETALERAKVQLLADHVYSLDSTFYQAMQIGMLESTGIGWEALREFEERVRAVTAEDILAAARRYLVPERLTVGVLRPAEAPTTKAPPTEAPQADEDEKEGEA